MDLLSYGRHLRLDNDVKIVVGRNKKDNDNILMCYRQDKDVFIKTKDIPGPVALIPNGCGNYAIARAASITAGYSKAGKDETVTVCVTKPDGLKEILVTAIPNTEVQDLLIP